MRPRRARRQGLDKRAHVWNRLAPSPLPSFECLEVRRRTPSGRLSEPAVLCRSEGETYHLDALGRGEGEGKHFAIGCDQRGVLVGGDEAGKVLAAHAEQVGSPQPASAPDAEPPDEEPVVEEEDAGATPGMPSGSHANTASCSAAQAPARLLAPSILAIVALALARRRRQG